MDTVPQQYPEPPAPTRAVRLGDEIVIPLDAQLALVASQTEADVWHVVDHGHCDCKAFRYRETCRHLALAAQAIRYPADTAPLHAAAAARGGRIRDLLTVDAG